MTLRHLPVLIAIMLAAFASQANAQASAAPFTSALRYDAMRQVVGTIAPDPDGTGPLHHAAVRNSYNGAGQLTRVEKGELSAWQSEAVAPASWSGFTIFQTIDFAYDPAGRKVKQTLSGGGTVHTVTQYDYDADNRLVCTRTRMHAAAFGTNPAACTAETEGTAGPDRIVRNVYDAAGQLVQVREGVGTSIEAAEATYSYTNNGKRKFVMDGRGNRAELRYDGHDRQVRWVFPSTTAPTAYNDASQATALASAGALNEADYEEYVHDPAGNRTSLRKRDGSTLTYSYDAANRASVKVVPERSGLTAAQTRDVYYSYDLRGLQRTARFGSLDGEGISNAYDGFGRLASSLTSMDGSALANSYQHDPDGNRTQLSTSSGYLLNFISDGLGRLIRVEEGGPNIVAQFGYDAAGRRSSLAMGTGGSFSSSAGYGYDAAGRLASLGTNLAGTAGDRTLAFGYNPASQIVAQTSDNATYAWNGAVNVNRNYTTNGLNQYGAAGPATFTSDANGNLITDGSTTYVYDVENRLVSASGAKSASLAYDPLGRLWQTSGGSAGTTRFSYDGDRLIEEYDGAGTRVRVYGHGTGIDQPLVWYELTGGSVRRFLHANHQGSIVALAGETGNLVAINSYDEYGIPAATNLGRFQYTGQTWIAELGMYYYKARIYSPTLGRFLQTDPVGYQGGINLYTYVNDDPANLTDPSGKNPIAIALCAGPQAAVCGGAIVIGTAVGCVAHEPCRSAAGRATEAAVDGIRGAIRGIRDRLFTEQPDDKGDAPPANDGKGKPHGSPDHDAAIDEDIRDMRNQGYTDIRRNQAQVDAQGNKVGNNRPDAQGTRPDGTREIREQDRNPRRSERHGDEIRANDPRAICILNLLCQKTN